ATARCRPLQSFPTRRSSDLGMEEDPLFAEIIASDPHLPPFLEQAQRTRGVDDTPYLIEIYAAISREYEAAVVQGVRSPEEGLRRDRKSTRLNSSHVKISYAV